MSVRLRRAARRIRTLRKLLDEALTEGAEAAREAYTEDGMAETQIAAELGVNRLTVRRWLGKA